MKVLVVLSFICVAINTSNAGFLHGLENELGPPQAESSIPIFADHSNALQYGNSVNLQEQSHALHELNEQHYALQAPETHSAPSYSIQSAPAIAIQQAQPVVSVHQHHAHAQPALAIQQQHVQQAVIHQGPESLSSLGDTVLQGHTVNGNVVSEQVVNGQLVDGALVSHSNGPVSIVRYPVPFTVHVDRPYPVAVDRPYPVDRPYEVKVNVPTPYAVHVIKHIAQPYPVYVDNIIVRNSHSHRQNGHGYEHGHSFW